MLNEVQGSSKFRVSVLFILFERTVEHKVNAIRIYMQDVDDTVLTFQKIPEK